MYTPSFGIVQDCLLISPTRIHLRKPKLNQLIGIKLYKIVCAAIVSCARKKSMHI